MSSLIVEVCTIDSVEHHPNADRLDICQVKGWQVITKRDEFKQGDLCVYFPPDTIIPQLWTDKFGVTNYCQEREQGMRIRQCRLRGEPSFGLVVPPVSTDEVGDDVAAVFNAQKYDPPILANAGDVAGNEHALFIRYTDIENINNFPTVFDLNEIVYLAEKLHGTNARVGMIDGELMAGSHKRARKHLPGEEHKSFYWYPYTIPGVKEFLAEWGEQHKQVILFGETFGRVQSMKYGLPNDISFMAFDIYCDGNYLDADDFVDACNVYGIPMVPRLAFCGHNFSLAEVKQLSAGQSLIEGADHIREGVVIRPVKERRHPKIGRVILKSINPDYLLGKHADKDTKDE